MLKCKNQLLTVRRVFSAFLIVFMLFSLFPSKYINAAAAKVSGIRLYLEAPSDNADLYYSQSLVHCMRLSSLI